MQVQQKPLPGPAVVITGASEGVGLATAKLFAAAGYHVVLAARTEENLETAAAAARPALKPGRQVITVPCDITSQEDVATLQKTAAGFFADIRVLICNAGACMTGDFEQHSVEDFEAQMGVNFLGHVATTKAFYSGLLELAAAEKGSESRQRPTICFVNSFGGRMPLPNMTAYCASKYALQGFVDSLRIEAEPQGVRVATVHPGVIRSDFRKRAQWRGPQGEARRAGTDELLDGSGPMSKMAQSVDEVAEEVLKTVQGNASETVVGAPFKVLVGAHGFAKFLGIV